MFFFIPAASFSLNHTHRKSLNECFGAKILPWKVGNCLLSVCVSYKVQHIFLGRRGGGWLRAEQVVDRCRQSTHLFKMSKRSLSVT